MNLINTKTSLVMLTGLLLLTISHTTSADVTFVHTDHQGTPVAYSDAQGNVFGEEATTPFGESLNAPTSNDLPAYTGHVRDGATGLVYMQARYYDPVVGRFMSTDPVGFESGGVDYFNRYSYVANNPIGRIDPTGMASENNEFSCGRDPNTTCYNSDEAERQDCSVLFDDGCAVKRYASLDSDLFKPAFTCTIDNGSESIPCDSYEFSYTSEAIDSLFQSILNSEIGVEGGFAAGIGGHGSLAWKLRDLFSGDFLPSATPTFIGVGWGKFAAFTFQGPPMRFGNRARAPLGSPFSVCAGYVIASCASGVIYPNGGVQIQFGIGFGGGLEVYGLGLRPDIEFLKKFYSDN